MRSMRNRNGCTAATWWRWTAALILSMITASSANAILTDYGTAELITFRNCIAGTTDCDNVSAPVQFLYGGSPGQWGMPPWVSP